MTNSAKHFVIWVAREDADAIEDLVLAIRAGIEVPGVEVQVQRLGRWNVAAIPKGATDETGRRMSQVLNIGYGELPPEGRVFLVHR